jgi:hypothetical protein
LAAIISLGLVIYASMIPDSRLMLASVINGSFDVQTSMALMSEGLTDQDGSIINEENDLSSYGRSKKVISNLIGNNIHNAQIWHRHEEQKQPPKDEEKGDKITKKCVYSQNKHLKFDERYCEGYFISLNQYGIQDLKQLKTDYPTIFGWLSDTDKIYKTSLVLSFKTKGFVKGRILPIDQLGYVLYLRNGYQPDYNDEEYINDNRIPVEFQFKGEKGEKKVFNFYTSKPVTKNLGRYAEIEFIKY